MKRYFHTLLSAIFALLAGSLTAQVRTLENVSHGEGVQGYKVTAVQTNDTATILNLEALHLIHYWTQLDGTPAPVIVGDDGKSYTFRGIEGYQFGKHMVTPLSGHLPFRMWFEPLPKSVKSFNLYFDAYGEYIANIPTQASHQSPDYLAQIPRKVIKNSDPKRNKWHELEPVAGDAEVIINLLGGHPIAYQGENPDPNAKQKLKLNYLCIDYDFTENNALGEIEVPEDGVIRFTVPVYCGATRVMLNFNENSSRMEYIYVEPGRNEFWWDMARWCRATSMINPTDEVYLFGDNSLATLTSTHSKLYRHSRPGLRPSWIFNPLGGLSLSDIEQKSFAELSEMIMDEWQAVIDLIQRNKKLSPLEKRYYSLVATETYYYKAVISISETKLYKYIDEQVLKGVYDFNARKNAPKHLWDDDDYMMFDDSLLNNARRKATERALEFLDPNSLLETKICDAYQDFHIVFWKPECLNSDTSSVYQRLRQTRDCMNYGKIYPDHMIYKQAVIYNDTLKAREKVKFEQLKKDGRLNIKNLDAAPEYTFKALLEEYRGEVAVIDLWATWCGPCRSHMSAWQRQPAKKELAELGVKWVYACVSGNIDLWDDCIAGIEGDHYFLENERGRAVSQTVDQRAYPMFLLVSKDGTWRIFDEMFSGNCNTRLIKEILTKELAK